MKARVFLITFFAPFVLYLLASQAALTTWSLREEYCDAINNLRLAVILEDTVSSADNVSSRVSEITGNAVQISSPEQQLEEFKAKFNVDVMSTLPENPFGTVIFSFLSAGTDVASTKSLLQAIDGVNSVVYSDSQREQIDVSFRDRHIKMIIMDVLLVLAVILQTWMAVRLEGAANESVMSLSGAPYAVQRKTFLRRAFIRGTCIGVFAAVSFLALRMALTMNHEVFFSVDFHKSLLVAAAVVLISMLLTYIIQLMAFPIAFKNSR